MSTAFNVIRYSCRNVMAQHSHRRRDHAVHSLRSEIWEMLDGLALRDRPIAYRLMADADAWERDYRRGSEGKRIIRVDDDHYVYLDWSRLDPVL